MNLTDPDIEEIEKSVAASDDALCAIEADARSYSAAELKRISRLDINFSFWMTTKNLDLFRDVFHEFGLKNDTLVVVFSDRSWIDDQMIRFHFGQPWFGDEPGYSRCSIGMTPQMMRTGGFFADLPQLLNVTRVVLEIDSKTEKHYPPELFRLLNFTPKAQSLDLTWTGEFPAQLLNAVRKLEEISGLKLRGHHIPATLPGNFFEQIDCISTLTHLKLANIDIGRNDLAPLSLSRTLRDITIDGNVHSDVATAVESLRD